MTKHRVFEYEIGFNELDPAHWPPLCVSIVENMGKSMYATQRVAPGEGHKACYRAVALYEKAPKVGQHCLRIVQVLVQMLERFALVIEEQVLYVSKHWEGYEAGKEVVESFARETLVVNKEGGEGHRLKGATAEKTQGLDRKSTRLNSSHSGESRMPSSA